MDSVHSKVSAYTALSVVIIFVSTTLFVCWKLTLGRGKDHPSCPSTELPLSNPRRPTLRRTYPEQWCTEVRCIDAATEPHEPLEKVLQEFVEERNRNLPKRIDALRQQEDVEQVHRYLDSVSLDSPRPALSQTSSLSQQSLYITSDRASDPVYNTINKGSLPDQSIRRSQSVSERGVRGTLGSTSIVPNSFLGAISKRETFKTIREYDI